MRLTQRINAALLVIGIIPLVLLTTYALSWFHDSVREHSRQAFESLATQVTKEVSRSLQDGSNALDFHIAYYLGALAKEDPAGFFHITSKDTGFDPLIKHLKARKIFSSRSESIEEMPCFAQLESKPTPPTEAQATATKAPLQQASGSVDELIRVAVDDLIRRKALKARTAKTLLNTIHAKCGKQRPLTEIEAVYQGLLKRGYVRVEGAKVTYALPGA